jgi:eukaryotic-like serine/threonine-protein kinase
VTGAVASEKASWELDAGAEIAEGRTVLKVLGGGKRYEVFLVWDDMMHAICVAKLLRPDQAEDEKALRDLGEEAALLERIAHPVIVRGFDAVLDGAYPHLMIEHLEGPSLRRLIRRGGPLPPEQLLPLALHVAGALHYLEQAGFVHLDVKPDNIIMGIPPRLIDLSIARSLEHAARSRGPIGTDAYMAPEQCLKDAAEPMGPPADVWGLGATLHHSISGKRPFPREKGARQSPDPDVRFPQLHSPPEPLPSSVSPDVAELISSMLSLVPGDRPSAAQVAERLEPAVARQPSRVKFGRRRGI